MFSKPDTHPAHAWIESDVIVLPADTWKIELELWPSMGPHEKPQLKDVSIVFCCEPGKAEWYGAVYAIMGFNYSKIMIYLFTNQVVSLFS